MEPTVLRHRNRAPRALRKRTDEEQEKDRLRMLGPLELAMLGKLRNAKVLKVRDLRQLARKNETLTLRTAIEKAKAHSNTVLVRYTGSVRHDSTTDVVYHLKVRDLGGLYEAASPSKISGSWLQSLGSPRTPRGREPLASPALEETTARRALQSTPPESTDSLALDVATAFAEEIASLPDQAVAETRQRLARRAASSVMAGTSWLTAAQVGRMRDPEASNPHAAATRWLQDGKVFALESPSGRLFPTYAFDELGAPLPFVREILQVFAGMSAFRVAAWFESPNSFLDGARPREAIAERGDAVLGAARHHVEGPVHG